MKRFFRLSALFAALLSLPALPAVADGHEAGVDEIVARHIEAKGGRDAWGAIHNLKLTGEFTAFSKINPFTQHKTRSRQYHMDHMWGDKMVVIGADGDQIWADNRFMQMGAKPVSGADLPVIERARDFATALFDIEELGHKVELLGHQDLEGQPAIAIALERADGSMETWYLDPETHLEVALDSPASDFGRPMTQRTWFDDFREVSGVMIPHYTETQWYTRHRVIDAETIEANVDLDSSLFAMPPPPGMERFSNLAGTWDVSVQARGNPGAPFSDRQQESVIESHFRGAMFEETWTTANGNQAIRTLSYDQFRDRYLATLIHSGTGALDLLAGTWNDEGALVMDDVVTETPVHMFGMTIYERMKIYDLAEDSFKIERENSVDGGENWAVMQKLVYNRKPPDSDGASE